MLAKVQPIGVCDLCGGPIPHDMWYTREHKPRLHCSLLCRNTANGRIKAKQRGQALRDRYHAGTWTPHILTLPGDERRRIGRTSAAASVAARNARRAAHLSQHPEDAPVSSAWRKLYRRQPLAPHERAATNTYFRTWRAQRLATGAPNERLRAAREQAGLTLNALAALIGTGRDTVLYWEQCSTLPRDPRLHARLETLLGPVFAHLPPRKPNKAGKP